MAEDQNANQNKNAQYQSNQAAPKLDAHGKPINTADKAGVQKPSTPSDDKNNEAQKNRSM